MLLYISIAGFKVQKVDKKKWKKDLGIKRPRRWKGANIALALYIGAKMGLILRFYLIKYTGKGTRKPGWVN